MIPDDGGSRVGKIGGDGKDVGADDDGRLAGKVHGHRAIGLLQRGDPGKLRKLFEGAIQRGILAGIGGAGQTTPALAVYLRDLRDKLIDLSDRRRRLLVCGDSCAGERVGALLERRGQLICLIENGLP